MTANEQRLGLVLGLVLLAGGAFIGLTKLKSWKQRVDTRAMEMESLRAEADELMAQKTFWDERSQWMAEKLPVYTTYGAVTETLLDRLQDLATNHQVVIQPQPTDTSDRPGLISVNMNVTVQGEMKPLLAWMHDLQQPSEFINVTSFVLLLNEEKNSELIATISLQKWFRVPAA